MSENNVLKQTLQREKASLAHTPADTHTHTQRASLNPIHPPIIIQLATWKTLANTN